MQVTCSNTATFDRIGGGTSTAQMSMANGQRVRNRQPLGDSAGFWQVPAKDQSLYRLLPFGIRKRIAEMRAAV